MHQLHHRVMVQPSSEGFAAAGPLSPTGQVRSSAWEIKAPASGRSLTLAEATAVLLAATSNCKTETAEEGVQCHRPMGAPGRTRQMHSTLDGEPLIRWLCQMRCPFCPCFLSRPLLFAFIPAATKPWVTWRTVIGRPHSSPPAFPWSRRLQPRPHSPLIGLDGHPITNVIQSVIDLQRFRPLLLVAASR